MQTLLFVLLAFAPATPEAETAHFSCGPYLLLPSSHSMTIVVDNEAPVSARLRFWSAHGEDEQSREHATAARHHVFTLTNLVPDTLYSYEITSDELSTQTHAFRTLPEHPQRYRVLVMGDVRTQPQIWAQVSGRMFEHETDALFAIGTGDYPSDGRQYSQWIEQFFSPARRFLGRIPLWPAIGNHEATRSHDDVTRTETSHYFSLFELPENERWYRVDYPLMTLLVLDSNSHLTPGLPQYEWLRDQLRSPRNRFTLVALHHAPLTSGPHGGLHSDGTPREWPIDEGRRFLVPLCEMYHVDMVLTGHDHLYERSHKGGVVYVVTGGGGAPLYQVDSVDNPYQQVALATHHYVALDIDASGIELSAIDRDGVLIDHSVVPATEGHEARRTISVTRTLEQALDIGQLDPATHMLPVTLFNPLDHPLNVTIVSRSGNPEEPLVQTLAVGERRQVLWQVGAVGFDLRTDPWRAPVVLDLTVRYQGLDQALVLDLEETRKLTVYHPRYPALRLDGANTDGALLEWDEVPWIRTDARTPIVKQEESYEGPGDFGAKLKLAWTEGWLHLAADISDSRIVDDPAGDIGENDCVRLLFDIPAGPDRGVAFFSFSASGRAEASTEAPNMRHAVQQRDGGWILEASIAFETLGLEPGSGANTELSCDFLFVDRDLEGAAARPSYHRLWTRSLSRRDASTFGVLQLQD
jgi:hypothetical protein